MPTISLYLKSGYFEVVSNNEGFHRITVASSLDQCSHKLNGVVSGQIVQVEAELLDAEELSQESRGVVKLGHVVWVEADGGGKEEFASYIFSIAAYLPEKIFRFFQDRVIDGRLDRLRLVLEIENVDVDEDAWNFKMYRHYKIENVRASMDFGRVV